MAPRRIAKLVCAVAFGGFGLAAEIHASAGCQNIVLMQRGSSRLRLAAPTRPSFTIANNSFMKDGEPFVIRAGSIHYARIPRGYWRDRLERVRALGLNTITTYAFWNFAQEEEGKTLWDDQRDIVAFFELAQQLGLLVIFRPGPYICGEWEMGGLPAWLLRRENIRLRTYNEPYIEAVDRWWGELLPKMKPLLYSNGGPIIMVQLENEYGSFGDCAGNPDDAKYMFHLYDLATKHLGNDVLYSTVDGGEDNEDTKLVLARGSPWRGNASVLATIDGGVLDDYSQHFAAQRSFNAPGRSPKMWSELWVGWFDFWGFRHHTQTATHIGDGVRAMANTPGASFSLYMVHGGTSGTWAGANIYVMHGVELMYQPDISSYDYNAPISEEGHHGVGKNEGDMFEAVKSAIASSYGLPAYDEPPPLPLGTYDPIDLTDWAPLLDNLDALSTCRMEVPQGQMFPSFEQLGLSRGLVVYTLARSRRFGPIPLLHFSYEQLRDYVQVLVDGRQVGTAYRADVPFNNIVFVPPGSTMSLVVESMGRVNYGHHLAEHKGLLRHPPLRGMWTARCIRFPLETLDRLNWTAIPANLATRTGRPIFRRGILRVTGQPHDTMISTRGLSKGFMWMNGRSIGRYWEVKGPRHSIYVPAPYLRSGVNELVVFDFQDKGGRKTVDTTTHTDWGEWNYFGSSWTTVHSGNSDLESFNAVTLDRPV
mmetsp:Transcript_125489/g.360724  ORF Transcript_125489/g.360724 Transcript_125489/m.360724 type:complete len:705 (+) Transcript_125489:95-2209(+)